LVSLVSLVAGLVAAVLLVVDSRRAKVMRAAWLGPNPPGHGASWGQTEAAPAHIEAAIAFHSQRIWALSLVFVGVAAGVAAVLV
jgi:hypothetical protein